MEDLPHSMFVLSVRKRASEAPFFKSKVAMYIGLTMYSKYTSKYYTKNCWLSMLQKGLAQTFL